MSDVAGCDAQHSHETRMRIEGEMPSMETMTDLATLFKLFADPTRMRILLALYHGDLCVCDLAELLGMTQSAISHQLRFLRNGRAVKAHRDGKQMIYSLHDNHVTRIFEQGLVHINEHHARD